MNKIALVTGAGSGIGKAVSLTLMREGYSLVLAGRRAEALEEVAAVGEKLGAEILAVPTDVGDPEAVENLFAKTKERFGRLDLLFNNAGIGTRGTLLEDLSHEQWMAVVNTNLMGSLLFTQHAFKIMKAQGPMGGRIINNGSVSAQTPRPNSAPYSSTKHAITGLTKATSLDGRKYDIACGQIDIGNAVSPMSENMPNGLLQPDGNVRPEPLMDVECVADGVKYMASLPLDANVQFLTVMATKMPFIGRG